MATLACKVMPIGTKGADREIEILQHLPKHRNVVTFHRAVQTSQNLYIFLELCDQGNLTEFIERRGSQNPDTQKSILKATEA